MPLVVQPVPLSGMGNRTLVPTMKKAMSRFNVVTWNARALLTKDPGKRQTKLGVLDRVLLSANVVLLQEVHGTQEEAALAFFRYERDWLIRFNPGPDRNNGGTAIFIKKDDLKAECSVTNDNLIAGRVQRVEVLVDAEHLVLWNIHHEHLAPNRTREVVRVMTQDVEEADGDSLRRAVWSAGDWNFLAPGETQLSIASPVACSSAPDNCSPLSSNQTTWQETLGRMTELQQSAPTRFSTSSLTCSRLDRIYTSTPGWILTSLSARAFLFAQPRELHERGVSDHAPVCAAQSMRRRLPRDLQPIPRDVIESIHFKEKHDQLAKDANLDALPVVQRWERHKAILRKAGEHARNALLNARDQSNFQVNQTLTTIARVVWHNDVRLGRKLLECSSIAQEHLIVSDAEVQLKCPATFSSCVSQAKVAFYAKAHADLDADFPDAAPKKKLSKMQAISRLAKLWAPQDKRLILDAVKIPSHSGAYLLERSPAGRSAALASAWAPIFSTKIVDEGQARSFCAKWCAPLASHLLKPISNASVRSFLRSAKHSQPGPDGVPYLAWEVAGDVGAETLRGVNDFLASGYSMPITFSDQLLLFGVKGEDSDDALEVRRVAGDTRPLSLKNSDNKTIAGVNNHAAKSMLAASVIDIQRGFVPGRQLVQNVLELDTFGRWFGPAGHVNFDQDDRGPLANANDSPLPAAGTHSKKRKGPQKCPACSAPGAGASTIGSGPPDARMVGTKK